MKNVYIHCPLLPPEDYRRVLEKLCPDSVRNATIYLYAERTCTQQLKSLIDVQKEFGLQRPIRFRNVVVFSQIPRLTKDFRRVLLKNNISVDLQVKTEQAAKLVRLARRLSKSGIIYRLWVDEQENQWAAYRQFSAQGLHLYLRQPHYTAETADLFSQWLYDPQAQGINTFSDIIAMLTLDTASPNCRYASCLGTTFRVDEQLQVYLCPYHMNEHTCLGKLTDRDTLLQCDAVVQLLTDAIGKRGKCSDTCSGFHFCQGGCLLEAKEDPECIHYIATVDRIRESLLDVYHNNKLGQVNNIVKNAILNAFAFGTAFFK